LNLLAPSWPDLTCSPGDRLEIRWCLQPLQNTLPHLTIELVRDSLDGGSRWTIAENIQTAPESFVWTVPEPIPAGPGYRIRLEASGLEAASVSNYPFRISSQ